MNQDINESRENYTDMVARLIAAARGSQNASDMFDEAVGKLLGSNRTDARCADIIQRYGSMSAGELAKRANLTTGAVTTVIDRLEKSGIARRVRDKTDRRKVYIELTDFTNQITQTLFAGTGEVFAHAMKDVSYEELKIISQYLEFTQRMNSSYAQIMQKHLPKSSASRQQRLKAAQGFAKEQNHIKDELIASWGKEPDEPPATGKFSIYDGG